MKILLVKLSSLGDVVHALPVVQDIHAAVPDAQIDWVLEKSFAPVLAYAPGVRRIVVCELRRWRKSLLSAATRREWLAFRAELQQEAYDAVIDLQGLSKSALVARLARLAAGGKRYALANQTDGSGYEAPTRWVADVAIAIAPHTPVVQRCRELAARALGYKLPSKANFGLKVPLALVNNGSVAIKTIANLPPLERSVAFVHGSSRADKQWPLAHWVALGRKLHAAGYGVVLAHGNPAELACSHEIARQLASVDASADADADAGQSNAAGPGPVSVLPMLALDELMQQLTQCVGVVGVDSGVSHIAVALALPHVQIYNFDTAWRTGPEALGGAGRQVSVFAPQALQAPQPPQTPESPNSPTVDAVWSALQRCWAAAAD